MNTPRMNAWHAAPALLVAYAGGRAGPVDAASLEVHLTGCPLCRAELGLVVEAADAERLERLRALVPTPPRHRPAPAVPSALRVLAPLGTVVAVLAAVVAAFALDIFARTDGGLLRLLAPAVPLAGVALCASRPGDPCREAVTASPSSGLRLTLWRTLVVLAIAVPLTALVGLPLRAGSPPRGCCPAWRSPRSRWPSARWST